ncbi:hypothetical protein F4779DRAFT_627117 [Xylariaceae sp. FL0662B]|nr:hypothetical protein F4779DRAFT_627117 [Xylariaceae sp. FL0662B]
MPELEGHNGPKRPLPPPNRRRNKPQLSCNLCRQRKVKCDRQQPCKTCCNRGLTCVYPPYYNMALRSSDRDRHRRDLQDRISDLESLALDLMQQARPKDQHHQPTANSTTPTTNSAPVETFASSPNHSSYNADSPGGERPPESSDCGTLTDSSAGVNYVNSVHWTALLDSIADLKCCFSDTEPYIDNQDNQEFQHPQQVIPDRRPSPLLLYGHFTHASMEEILSAIPPRPIVDRLVARSFHMLDIAPALLHRTQFLRQYEQFWARPSEMPVMWVGLLFAIMCFATEHQLVSVELQSRHAGPATSEPDIIPLIYTYREKIVQCLTLGGYVRAGPHVVETLTLYLAVEHLLSEDTNFGISILSSIVVQIAMRKGYHRDPKNFPTISPFQGEMRRRVWATINHLDHSISCQMGLPSMLQQQHVDTEEPRNLMDSDFDEGSTELPPSRPETEITESIYTILKSRVSYVWRRVYDVATDARPHNYEEILEMDRKLQDEHERLPPSMRSLSTNQSIAESPKAYLQRMWLYVCFLRLRIILHKKYFLPSCSSTGGDYGYSRDVTLEAAMQIIEYQHVVFEETQPEGRLSELSWKFTAVSRHPFLLATSILCIYLRQHKSTPMSAEEPVIQKITRLLRRSLDIWLYSSTTSKEAQRAVDALNVILDIKGTAEVNCGTAESNSDQPLPLQGSQFELEFPFAIDSFVNDDNPMTDSMQGTEPIPFTQQQPYSEWVDLFQHVFIR